MTGSRRMVAVHSTSPAQDLNPLSYNDSRVFFADFLVRNVKDDGRGTCHSLNGLLKL